PAVCHTTARKEKRSWCCSNKKVGGDISVSPYWHRGLQDLLQAFSPRNLIKKDPTPASETIDMSKQGTCKHDPEKACNVCGRSTQKTRRLIVDVGRTSGKAAECVSTTSRQLRVNRLIAHKVERRNENGSRKQDDHKV